MIFESGGSLFISNTLVSLMNEYKKDFMYSLINNHLRLSVQTYISPGSSYYTY